MKIRIIGTKDECQKAAEIYTNMMADPRIKSLEISALYPNRSPNTQYRIYIDIEYKDTNTMPKIKTKSF